MSITILTVTEKYLTSISIDEYHRYKSWDNCFQAFSATKQADIQILELAFYLASWGMYRGSSGLLQKNHLIHKGAVDILFSMTNQKLKCNQSTEINRDSIAAILSVKNELTNYYSQDKFKFIRGSEEAKPISTTDTLLSKIMLGTLGCVPAYDRYFIEGLKVMKMKYKGFNEASLKELFSFIDYNRSEFNKAQILIKAKTQIHYPIMKILDMYFWQIGYDSSLKIEE